MKMMKKILASALAAAMLFSLSSVSVFASEGSTDNNKTIELLKNEYTYTLTLHAGNHGNFAGLTEDNLTINGVVPTTNVQVSEKKDKIVISGLNKDDSVYIVPQNLVTIKSEEESQIYYVKGLRESGQDASVTVSAMTIENVGTLGDMEYVMTYAIKGDQIPYTVHYQDVKGNTLSASQTFYANKGDKPIVVYKNIDGYAPVIKAYTQTIDQEGYSFTFVYDKVPTQTTKEKVTEETEVDYVTIGGETIIVNGGGATGGTASNVTGGVTGGNAEAEDTTAGGEGAAVPGIDESEIVDLDDEETPLANVEVNAEETAGSSTGVYVALGLLAVIIAAVVAYIASKKKKVQE